MMKLLVSVRDVGEAQIAIDAGVDLIDLKEPRDGSLGSTSPAVWEAVASLLPDGLPMSIALGELVTLDVKALQRIPHRVTFAKVGNAGLALRDAESSYRRWIHELPSWVEPVAVFYADHIEVVNNGCFGSIGFGEDKSFESLLPCFYSDR